MDNQIETPMRPVRSAVHSGWVRSVDVRLETKLIEDVIHAQRPDPSYTAPRPPRRVPPEAHENTFYADLANCEPAVGANNTSVHQAKGAPDKGSGNRMSGNIKYEYKSVQTMRGLENRSIEKAQNEGGWELVDQAQGTLRTTLNFRRVKPETFLSKAWDAFRGLAPAKQRSLAAAVAVLLVLAAVGIGIAAAHDKGDPKAQNSATKSTGSATVNETPITSPTPTPSPSLTPSEETEPIITAENNKELAALLNLGDNCDPSMAQFAAKYQDQKIEFDGSIENMQKHEKYDTRYDILLGPGDAGPNTGVGPAFKYDNVNMFDLNLTGMNIPSSVSTGAKFRFTAKVGAYNPKQCLFFLTPVSTTVR
ncbi:DUF4839 domain-containing protein [Arthrobacter methylotrophus]